MGCRARRDARLRHRPPRSPPRPPRRPPRVRSGAGAPDEGLMELHDVIRQVGIAAMQVAQAGTDAQAAEARRILTDARRALYRILAEDEPREGETGEA